jgi:CheY-like chemotaxis protein
LFKKKILVVDDSDFFLRAIDSTLSQDSYEVILASSGEEGLRLVREEKPDLVLLDVVMRM